MYENGFKSNKESVKTTMLIEIILIAIILWAIILTSTAPTFGVHTTIGQHICQCHMHVFNNG